MKIPVLALVAGLFSGAIAENVLNFNATTPVNLGDPLQVSFLTEPDRFALVRLVVKAPNGTVAVAESRGNINSTSTALTMGDGGFIVPNNATGAPETRTCSQMTGKGINGTLTFIPDRVGTWRWTVFVEYYYGSQGYESATDGSSVCISPPFSRETLHIEPVSLQFIADATIQPVQETIYSIDPRTISVPTSLSRNIHSTAVLAPEATGSSYNRTVNHPSSSTAVVPSISYLTFLGLLSFFWI
ncbi:hypothetical protein FRC17_011101 [Serendipita sp. 399]|nr:hypothetical protein FRC17_011101 [Serendipita sp. 399]